MRRSIRDIKKPVGRPRTTGTGTIIGTRWHDEDLAAVDAWCAQQDDQPDRAEALRRLVRLGLKRRGKG
jgi:hypothetical protein